MIVHSVHTRPIRVCVTGAACTGKTALATALGSALGAPVIFGNTRSLESGARHGESTANNADLLHVIEMQTKLEDRAPRSVPLLVLDTDLFTALVHREREPHGSLEELDELLDHRQRSDRRIDLYVLSTPDGSHRPDVHPGAEHPLNTHRRIRDELLATGRQFIEVSGTLEQRTKHTVEALRDLLAQQAVLAAPTY